VDAAERGLGSLGLTFGTVEEQEEKLKRYRRIIRNCQPVGDFVNEQIATINFLYCHEDNAQGVATGRRITDRFIPLATQFIHNPEAIPTRSGASQGLLRYFAAAGFCAGRRTAGNRYRQSRTNYARAEKMGSNGHRLRQLCPQRAGGGSAGAGARQPAALCARSDAAF
jgi:hypothetical protein